MRGRNPSTSYQGCDRVGTHVPNNGDARRKVGTQVRNSETQVRNSRDAGPEQWGRRCGTVGTQVRNSGDIHAEQWGRRCGTVGTLVRNSEDAGPEQWGRWSGTVGTLVRKSGDADAERWERWCGTVGRWSGTVGRWSGRVGMLVRKGGNAGAETGDSAQDSGLSPRGEECASSALYGASSRRAFPTTDNRHPSRSPPRRAWSAGQLRRGIRAGEEIGSLRRAGVLACSRRASRPAVGTNANVNVAQRRRCRGSRIQVQPCFRRNPPPGETPRREQARRPLSA